MAFTADAMKYITHAIGARFQEHRSQDTQSANTHITSMHPAPPSIIIHHSLQAVGSKPIGH